MVHPYQAYQKCKYSHMDCSVCVQFKSYENGIYSTIDTQILNTAHDILVYLVDLNYGTKPGIDTLKK